jgi:hypothetical protein
MALVLKKKWGSEYDLASDLEIASKHYLSHSPHLLPAELLRPEVLGHFCPKDEIHKVTGSTSPYEKSLKQ